MSIDLDKNRNAILEAFNDVLNDKTKTDWALFGYEQQSYVLKLIGTGEDGVEEMADDLNSSKIMYAIVRVTDPNTTRPKVVLINWQGEGAPTLLKGTCARHLNDVNKFLRGIHVTVNARTEEEVEPELIMEAVLKASATTYNFNERSEINDKTIPVGTNYKRTNPLAEINTKSRNQFWEEQEAEEKKRKVEEQKKRDEELKLMENERKQREIEETKQREVLMKERNARILSGRKAEDDASKRLAAQDEKKWHHDVKGQHEEEQERSKRAEIMRLERKKEAESLIGQRTHSTRAIFESGTTTSEQSNELNRPPPRKLKEFKPANNMDRVENEPTNVIPTKGVTSRWPPANNSAQKEDTSFNQNKGKVSPLPSAGSRFTNQESTVPNSKHHIPEFSPPRTVQPQEITTQKEIFPTTQKEIFPSTQKDVFPSTVFPSTQKEVFPSTQKEVFPSTQKEVFPSPQKEVFPTTQKEVFPTTQKEVFPSPQKEVFPSTQREVFPSTQKEVFPTTQKEVFPSPQKEVFPPQQKQPILQQPPQPQSVQQQHSPPAPHSNGDVSSYNYNADVVPNKVPVVTSQHDQIADTSSHRANEVHDSNLHNSHSTEPAFTSTPSIGMVYEVDGMEYQILPEHGLCARALYDYQAADDTEITFDPEEIITNIDQIDAGWWQGVGPDGNFGLFPANYVELINHSGV